MFNVIWGAFGALVSKWHVTQKVVHGIKWTEIWDAGNYTIGPCDTYVPLVSVYNVHLLGPFALSNQDHFAIQMSKLGLVTSAVYM